MIYLSNNIYTYLIISVFLFSAGLYGAVRNETLTGILISIVLILNSATLNFITFSNFIVKDSGSGQIFTLVIMAVGLAQVIVIISYIIVIYKKYASIDTTKLDILKK